MKLRALRNAAVWPARIGLDALLATVRYSLDGDPVGLEMLTRRTPVIYVLWHGRLLPLAHYHRGRGLGTLISPSADGDAIASVVEGWDFVVVRGSSSRSGAAGLRSIVRGLRAGRPFALTPDGPRGPAQRMKHGPLVAAQLAGVPILPATAAANRAWWFGTWDRFLVPQPFSRVLLRFGRPIEVPGSAAGVELDQISSEVEAALNELTARTDVDVAA
ncbi:MAG: lysophospholipid acyltransferase family protein [Gemmatimonadetes bacterium]|nr:lysophospholipid acyltransferase family protein [Gemmatimonadota bacterium]